MTDGDARDLPVFPPALMAEAIVALFIFAAIIWNAGAIAERIG